MSSADAPITAELAAFLDTPGPAVSDGAALKDYIALSIAARREQAEALGLTLAPEPETPQPVADSPVLEPINPDA